MKTLNIIGCGRVGRTLGRRWHSSQALLVQDVMTTSIASAAQAVGFMGAGRPVPALSDMRPADIWMIAVPDTQIEASAEEMAKVLQGLPPATAFHCSGALTSAALDPLRPLGWPVASAHCILSFASAAAAVDQFAGTPCGLEGDASATGALSQAFSAIGAECFAVSPEHKLLYHAAAVFATNFLPVLQTVANDLWRDAGVPPELIPRLSASLLRHAVHNVISMGPAAALTGPAARGDTALIELQGLAVSQWDASAGEAYRALSQLALRIARDGGLHAAPEQHDQPR